MLSFKLSELTLKLCCMYAGQHEPNLCAVPLELNLATFAFVVRLHAGQEKNCVSVVRFFLNTQG